MSASIPNLVGVANFRRVPSIDPVSPPLSLPTALIEGGFVSRAELLRILPASLARKRPVALTDDAKASVSPNGLQPENPALF